MQEYTEFLTKEELKNIIAESAPEEILQDGRNFIFKTKDKEGNDIVVKSFKKPNIINRYIYGNFRKSKARRSFEYAQKLRELGIGTPEPLQYIENFKNGALQDSYYVSKFQPYDLTYRELVENPDYQDGENILRQFTAFSYQLHKNGILFKDHSPGNTLIKKVNNDIYEFFLVDLNRMEFAENPSFEERVHNLRRLTPKKEMVEIMADEYANHSGESKEDIFQKLWKETEKFQKKFRRKKRLKAKIKGK